MRLDYIIEECGHFANGVLPVKIADNYIYINKKGKDANLGTYDYASSMFDGKAAVLTAQKKTSRHSELTYLRHIP